MKRKFWFVALVCLGVGLVAVGAAMGRQNAKQMAVQVPTARFYPTEQLWIVKDVTAAIANMAAYPTRKPTRELSVRQVERTNGELARFEVAATGQPIAIRIIDHIWSPESYRPLAAALMGKTATCDPPGSFVATALLEPTRQVIQRENTRVSERLRANMRCADAHAEAALIVGTLALREAATVFYDPRRLISRMTAHLAIADALGAPADSQTRRLSEAVLYTLVGRQQTALERLMTLESADSNATL